MKSTTLSMVATALVAAVAYCEQHREVGITAQDEAIATAIDGGLSQTAYLSLAYGGSAEAMLDAAFEARSAYFIETHKVVKHLALGDIRNVPCAEPTKKVQKTSYMKFSKACNAILFKPETATPISGKMFGVDAAFQDLLARAESRIGKPIRIKGANIVSNEYSATYDPQGLSYSFWPLGAAIHAKDGYAEEVAHFFNFCDPRKPPMKYKGTWSSPDYAKVSQWNEFVAALRGLKVHAFALGVNLNESHYTMQQVVDENFVTNMVEVAGTPRFDTYYAMVEPNIDSWLASNNSPIATNAFVLLLAYREAKSNEDKETDNAAYRRLREFCRDFNIARMVL